MKGSVRIGRGTGEGAHACREDGDEGVPQRWSIGTCARGKAAAAGLEAHEWSRTLPMSLERGMARPCGSASEVIFRRYAVRETSLDGD